MPEDWFTLHIKILLTSLPIILSLLAVSRCLPLSVLIMLHITCAYGSLWDIEVVSQIFLYLHYALAIFLHSSRPSKGKKKKKKCLLAALLTENKWSEAINSNKIIFVISAPIDNFYYSSALMERSLSYAVNFHTQTSTKNGKRIYIKRRAILANPLCWSSICPGHTSQQRPLEAAHGSILLRIGIHHTGDPSKYSTICGTAICSHGAYMKVPQLSHFWTICCSHLYPMDLELRHNVNGKA